MLPDGAPVRLTQETDYPWDGRIRITIEDTPEHPWALMLRIPGWTGYASLRVNGETVAVTPETYARLKRTWSPGDTVELGLPMKPRLVKSNPKGEETRTQVGVMWGPLVYCLESTDLPDGVSVSDVCLARTAILRETRDPEQFGNMVLLDGVAFRTRGEKTDKLYQMLERDSSVALRVRLIPYYAWNNRGEPEMSVWLLRC